MSLWLGTLWVDCHVGKFTCLWILYHLWRSVTRLNTFLHSKPARHVFLGCCVFWHILTTLNLSCKNLYNWKPAPWNPLFEESRLSTSEGEIAGYMPSAWWRQKRTPKSTQILSFEILSFEIYRVGIGTCLETYRLYVMGERCNAMFEPVWMCDGLCDITSQVSWHWRSISSRWWMGLVTQKYSLFLVRLFDELILVRDRFWEINVWCVTWQVWHTVAQMFGDASTIGFTLKGLKSKFGWTWTYHDLFRTLRFVFSMRLTDQTYFCIDVWWCFYV